MANFDDILDGSPPDEQNKPPLSKGEYASRKKDEREAVYALADSTAAELAGDGGKFRQYLDVQAKFSRYSAVNALLITAQKPEATHLGDFDYWKSQGGSVKQGQTGISILKPGRRYKRKDGFADMSYNIKKVFDISQVDARKIGAAPAPKFTERQILRALVSKYPMKIMVVDELPDDQGAVTDPDGNILVLKDMTFSDTFRSVAYEMACAEHATDPELSPDEEFYAYCTTYLLCKKYGVDTKEFDFDQVSGVFDGMDAQEIRHELSQIRDAADAIAGRMEKQLNAPSKAAKSREDAR